MLAFQPSSNQGFKPRENQKSLMRWVGRGRGFVHCLLPPPPSRPDAATAQWNAGLSSDVFWQAPPVSLSWWCDMHTVLWTVVHAGLIPQPDTAERDSLSFRVTTGNTILTGTGKWFQFGNKAKVHDYVCKKHLFSLFSKCFSPVKNIYYIYYNENWKLISFLGCSCHHKQNPPKVDSNIAENLLSKVYEVWWKTWNELLDFWNCTSTALDLHNGPAWLPSFVRRLLRAVAVTTIKVFVAWPILSTIEQSWTFVSSSSLLLWHVL